MGLFWMTAPIAWLYAIPVERFTSSLASAQFNAALLVVVSVWRVLLMARVLAVLCGVSMRKSLVWVLVPALIEVLAVFLGGVGEIIGRSMGGMQLSPEKEFILKAQSQVFGCVIWALPVVLIWAYWDRAKLPIQALPISRRVEPLPWRFLLGTALFWLAVAVYPQMEQSRNAHLEKLIEEQHWREALDFMADQGKESFAPSRPLPPPNYGSQANKQTPPLLDAATAKDPAWLRLHLAQRGGSWALNLTPGFRVFNKTNDFKENMEILVYRFSRYNDSAKAFSQWLNGMQRLPEGRDWLSSHPIVLRALANAVQEALQQESPLSLTRQERESWQSLEKALRDQGIAPDLPDLNPSVNPLEEP
jgi:hypothetical protein